jgi:hypothetical protein
MTTAQEEKRIKDVLRLPLLDLRSGNDAKVAVAKAAAPSPLFVTVTSAALPLLHVGNGKVEMSLPPVGSDQKC